MAIDLDEQDVLGSLRPIVRDERFRAGIANMVCDRTMLGLFLMGLSRGEGLGEAGVASIGEEDIARLIHNLELQRLEEHGHSAGAREMAERVCPEHFQDDTYCYEASVGGAPYYFRVREANRARLRELGRYSRLNIYLTTSFGYEIMVDLLFESVMEALSASTLPPDLLDGVRFVLGVIQSQEETHLGLIDQHNALLAADRTTLSPSAVAMLERLELLTADDYLWAAELSVREIVTSMGVYADREDVYRCLAEERCIEAAEI